MAISEWHSQKWTVIFLINIHDQKITWRQKRQILREKNKKRIRNRKQLQQMKTRGVKINFEYLNSYHEYSPRQKIARKTRKVLEDYFYVERIISRRKQGSVSKTTKAHVTCPWIHSVFTSVRFFVILDFFQQKNSLP